MLTIFLDIILPVFTIAGLAALSQRWLKLDVHTLARVGFDFFMPALVLDMLSRSRFEGEAVLRMSGAALVTTLVMWGLGALVSRWLRLAAPTRSAFLLALLLGNAGNYGLPVLEFAYGAPAMSMAALYLVISTILMVTIGVYVAAQGQATPQIALRRIARMPILYAAVVGLALNLGGVTLPTPLLNVVQLMSQAANPVFLVVLGLQLLAGYERGWRVEHLPQVGAVLVGRMLVSPVVAWGVALAFGLTGLTQHIFVLEYAFPTAVMASVLATEFDADPPCATLCVFSTTLLSLVTVTFFLWLLG